MNVAEKIFHFNKQRKGKELPRMLASRPWDFYCRHIKILIHKRMLQRLPIKLTQVKAGNTSENLLNEIRQITYFLYRKKEITKKVYNNIMNSVKLYTE